VIEGSRAARREAQATLALCLDRMGMDYFRDGQNAAAPPPARSETAR